MNLKARGELVTSVGLQEDKAQAPPSAPHLSTVYVHVLSLCTVFQSYDKHWLPVVPTGRPTGRQDKQACGSLLSHSIASVPRAHTVKRVNGITFSIMPASDTEILKNAMDSMNFSTIND